MPDATHWLAVLVWIIWVKIMTGMSRSCNNKYPKVRVLMSWSSAAEKRRDGEASCEVDRRYSRGRARGVEERKRGVLRESRGQRQEKRDKSQVS